MLVGSGTRDSTTLISAVLGAPSEAARDAETLELLDYGFSLYTTSVPVEQGEELADPELEYRDENLPLVAKAAIPVKSREGQAVDTSVEAPDEVSGAVEKGEELGRVMVTVDGEPAASTPLVAARSVEAASALDKAVATAQNPIVLLLLGAIVILVGAAARTPAGDEARRNGEAPPRRTAGEREREPTERTPEERRKMHEERMRRRRERMQRGGGPMILTVTLNAAIDRTVAVPSFRQGHRHRAVEASTVAGGKGVNVARALKLLGRPVIATGLAGGPTGARLMERLAEESILTDFTWIAGESRTNLAVIDPTTGEQTEINERGPDVSDEELERFLEKLLYLARGARICVIAGSLPAVGPRLVRGADGRRAEGARGRDDPRHRGRAAGRRAARRSRPRSPRTRARPRARSATSSTTARTCSPACAA